MARVLLGLVALIGVLAAWAAWDLRSARRELIVARQELSHSAGALGTATDASAAALRKATREAVARTRRADDRVRRSPVLGLAAIVPGVRTQRQGLLRATRTARDAARIGDALAAVARRQGEALTVRNGGVDLRSLRLLADAAAGAGRELRALPRTHSDAQWGPLGHATTDLDRLLADTASRLVNGAGVMRVSTDLLGATGPKRIFIALLNNAEMRDQGMVLSYATAETVDGSFRITRSGSVLDIPVPAPVPDVALPDGTRTIFGALSPSQLWQSVNATADTTLSGALMRSMYKRATGDTADAVVALDVPALSALLSVTGPLTVAGIDEPLTAQNAPQVLLHDLYEVAPGQSFSQARAGRQEQLAATVAAVVDHIRTTRVNGTSLVRALGNAARGGHAWMSTADTAGQRSLELAGLSGSPGRAHPERTIHVAVQNGTATKLDWFVKPAVDVDVAVTEDGTAVVNTTVRVPNSAPTPTPATEQFGPDGFVTHVAGLYRGRVYFWGPAGGEQVDSVMESGLRLNFKVLDVPAGDEASVSFSTVIPRALRNGVLRLRFVPQARAHPARLRVRVNAVGWRVDDAHRSLEWDQPADLTWFLHRR